MPFPKQIEVELPLLRALEARGGDARPHDIYPVIASELGLTPDEQEERLEGSPSTRKWSNLVRWVRQRLVELGQIDRSQRGVWRLTASGRERLLRAREQGSLEGRAEDSPERVAIAAVSLRDLMNSNTEEIKKRLAAELQELSPRSFEFFCRNFLSHLGFTTVEVTRTSQDGGIDGHGDFRQGAVRIRSAFQAKRWTKGVVGRPDIDRFRGAIQGEYDHGVFLTTSRFSRDAKEASYKKGAITILLLDGEAIAEMLLERGLGVRKSPLYVYDIDEEFFDIEDEE
ncbi:MAG TPA: restriction endonuclease [Thermoanaerobaculia bacterium]